MRILPLLLICFVLSHRSAEALRDRETSFYLNRTDTVSLDISLDQIALIAREGVPDSVLRAYTDSLGLVRTGTFPIRMFIFSVGDTLSRADLFQIARRAVRTRPDIAAQAGLRAELRGHRDPLIITDQFIVQFHPGVTRREINSLNATHHVIPVDTSSAFRGEYLLAVPPSSPLDGLSMALQYRASGLVDFSVPNFVRTIRPRGEFIPNDRLFPYQWYHRNSGQANRNGDQGTPDADMDTPSAWDIVGKVSAPTAPVIAVLDYGFQTSHGDLKAALWENPGEMDCATSCNGTDNDSPPNGLVDDFHGWYFHNCSSTLSVPCGDNNLVPTQPLLFSEAHGTAVAGLAAASTNNTEGIAGTCLNAKLMLLRLANDDWSTVRAIDYAWGKGADILVCAWGQPTIVSLEDAFRRAATSGRQGNGSITVIAMTDSDEDNCSGSTPDISSLDTVIGVSASDNKDRKLTNAGWGPCTEVLGPSDGGTLNVVATDWDNNDGFNAALHDELPTCQPLAASTEVDASSGEFKGLGYTACFTGTSAAAPLVGGVAGLVLSVNKSLPLLTRVDLQRLLQDTADRIDPTAGAYDPKTGYSTPVSGHPRHGFGRVNAYEAVRVTAPAPFGRNGVDLFLRDNDLDWGNTEQPSFTLFESERGVIPHWESPDIKIDAPPFQTTSPVTTSAGFDGLDDEKPAAAQTNRVYVRIRNRGYRPATSVSVNLYWTHFVTALPDLPSTFWGQFPNSPSTSGEWSLIGSIGVASVPYSGSSAAKVGPDDAQIASFQFVAPTPDPSSPNHYCLLAIAHSPDDPAPPKVRASTSPPSNLPSDFVVDQLTPTENNVTHRNVAIEGAIAGGMFLKPVLIANPSLQRIKVILHAESPPHWQTSLEGAALDRVMILQHGQRLVRIKVRLPARGAPGDSVGEVRLIQYHEEGKPGRRPVKRGRAGRPMGGVTIRFVAPKGP